MNVQLASHLVLEPIYRWRVMQRADLTVHFFGDEAPVAAIAEDLCREEVAGVDETVAVVSNRIGHFAAIFESPKYIVAVVDVCRTIPIFYTVDEKGFVVGNSAEGVRQVCSLEEVDDTSVLECIMAGYATGSNTLYEGLSQLQAGELLVWDKSREKLERRWYFKYQPNPKDGVDIDRLTDELDSLIHRIMCRVVNKADGNPILVPLSGGLDSRLILSKLVELGYSNLRSFSYGPPGNSEARAAKKVANILGVPWEFIPTSHADTRRFFTSQLRKDYFDFGDGLCSIPNIQDIQALSVLRDRGQLPENSLLVNGQSGDFITGGHIPAPLMEESPSVGDVISAIIDKHYSLWRSLMTEENLGRVERRIRGFIEVEEEKDVRLTRIRASSLYEFWEYHERQSKFVVDGQRIYDFMGLRWSLPLWDFEFIEFWKDIPPHLKFRQTLYRRYLERWNFKGLFVDFQPRIWGWNWPSIAFILPLSWMAKAVLGARRRDKLICYAHYFGRIGNHYAPIGFRKYLMHARDMQNPNSIYTVLWLDERGLMKMKSPL